MNNQNDNIIGRLYDSFGVTPPEQRMPQPSAGEEPQTEAAPVFVDLYKRDASALRNEMKKTRPNGSSPLVYATAEDIVSSNTGLSSAYKRAKDTVEDLKKKGFRERADIAKNQYMEENFLPAVEAVIRFSSPDELLNCKEALSLLDKYALGTGNMSGYTASYVKQAYNDLLGQDLDGRFNKSDRYVSDAVQRIKFLSASDNIRSAVGLANQIKKSIDNGEHIADDDDYALIVRVANF